MKIGIVMGSDSDLPIVQETAFVLEEFGVDYEISILSAHRTPDEAGAYAKTAKERGLQVIIAAAGGAAHLAGVLAAHTTLPVIGIPILSKSLAGADSLYSIVQMPPGIPVATVGINAAKNAGILALSILALADEELQTKLEKYKVDLAKTVIAKNKKLQDNGVRAYIEGMGKK